VSLNEEQYMPIEGTPTALMPVGELQAYPPPMLVPSWSPATPPPGYPVADRSSPQQQQQPHNQGAARGGGGVRRGRGGRGVRVGPAGDQGPPGRSNNNNNRRDVPSRMNGSPRHHYKSEPVSSNTAEELIKSLDINN
jgi:hypothetical protein